MDWIVHPSGIRSRPLPDGWPAVDCVQGWVPPFTVDSFDLFESETIGVFPTVQDAARKASRAMPWGRVRREPVEITDARNRIL